jgi:hypothetical protein
MTGPTSTGLQSALADEILQVQANLDGAVVTLNDRVDYETAELDGAKLDKHLGGRTRG